MKVTLIQARFNEGNTIVPPIGILYIAAVLEKAGHRVQVFDIDPSTTNIIDKIKVFKPDVIGFSFMTVCYKITKKLIFELKKQAIAALYCGGGIHASALPQETIKDTDLDFIVIGEGEDTFLEVCKRLEAGGSLEGIRGIVFRDNDQVIDNGRRQLIKNLDELPFPKRDLLNFELYLTPPGLIKGHYFDRMTTVFTTRGCPFKCTFCGSKVMNERIFRRRSVTNVIEEVELLVRRYNIKGLRFYDELFTLDYEWIKNFCFQIKKFNLVWGCNARVGTITEELVCMMKEAGCLQLDFGIESGSDKVLKRLKKDISREKILKTASILKKCRIRTMASYIVGNPDETYEDIQMTFDIAKRFNANFNSFYFLTPYPGTEVYDEAKTKGWNDNSDYSETWSFRYAEEPIMAINFSKKELMKIRNKLQNHFFFRNYINWANLAFGLKIFSVLLTRPGRAAGVLKKFLKTKRIDDVVEGALNYFRDTTEKSYLAGTR